MSFCASDWEGHGFLGAFPSTCKPLPCFTSEAPFVPDDAFEKLCWEDGQLRLHQKQLGTWEGHAPVEAAQVASVDPLDGQGNAASVHNKANIMEDNSSPRNRVGSSSPDFFDDEMIAWLQYPPDVELHTDNPAVSYFPTLPLDKSHSALYRDYVLMGAVDRNRQYMSSSQDTGLACRQTVVCTERHALSHVASCPSPNLADTADPTPGSASDMQAPEELVSPNMVVSLPRLDPHPDNSLQSSTRLAADASLASLGHVKDKANHIYTQNGGAGMSGDLSLESPVTGISTQEPSGLADTDCFKATSVTFHQVHGAVPTACRPDAVVCNDASCLKSNVDIKKFSESHRSKHGDRAKRKGKGSKESEIQLEAVSVKRSRTAALHNKSEKMRRDRINKKLRTLQELIPNADQTDKASLLGQTIEYLKALQKQLMVMSYRTGLTIPPRLISHSMRHPYAPQHTGAGFGAGSVKNKNVKGMKADAPACSSMRKLRPLMPSPALPSSASWVVGTRYAPSTHIIGYSANYFPMANVGM